MSKVDALLADFRERLRLPWEARLSSSEKVWLAVYDPAEERRVLARLMQFQMATEAEKKHWQHHDISGSFAAWLGANEYRDGYFASPEFITSAIEDFELELAGQIRGWLASSDSDTVVALTGLSSLFGLSSVARMISAVEDEIQGRMLGFFPGRYDRQTGFRLLDARDGWSYRAVRIGAH